ncbi:PAS domain-containing protein [Photorhabdus laumondii subsp. laumondii]|uniref:Photorhabdus luminescens subsp. laumondii TTO1 complete genome segment 7/17 n=2 Tax=Photorhabdus laumondii subsp. laumondii TaxID=141679 RepID=Q7N5E7_PHOLL|nr:MULTISPECIES: PAS and helix-turn-helix domain-containing protein [Photorhabdus]AWK41803.1 helix-turn-helix transcriptional regulator [Photorhabdus laumondii subsp. laumondii]AXG42624.1 helix-turn-helix transcriptional regulator [Photorhabdus laumondii subsp. laumondii]AXG47124.1 helix-turn-helix transcriptional regulator [Photorhabdus laumondii subsp. laumondii]MCC8384882.1 PAS domain-containing protein [Photorhabdus laumondii]MCC8388128.1 PAS domain-containing protein [Photorhabdus laumond
MNKNYVISPQIINTMEQSNEPWGIKDKNSCFIYVNQACKHLQNISSSFDYEGLYEYELPWDGAEFAKEYMLHDQKVMEQEKRICSLETHLFGKEQILSSYFLAKYPLYHENGSCMGVIYHGWQAQDFSFTRLFRGKLPANIMFQPPTDRFTQREWDVIFLILHKYTNKQIGIMLNISYRTVENHISRICKRIGLHSSRQLEEYCRTNDYDLYVPKRFVHPESKMFL